MCHIVPGCTLFFHIISWTAWFSKIKVRAIIFVSTFSTTLLETFFTIGRNERNVIEMYISLHVKYPLFLPDFHETWIFSKDFSKNYKMWNSIKIRPVGVESFHAERRTDGQTWRSSYLLFTILQKRAWKWTALHQGFEDNLVLNVVAWV